MSAPLDVEVRGRGRPIVLMHGFAASRFTYRFWADDLASRCHESKPEGRRRQKFFGNIAEDLSRLLAPLL